MTRFSIIKYIKSIAEQIDVLQDEISDIDKYQRCLREEVLVEISNYVFDMKARIEFILDILDYKIKECKKNNEQKNGGKMTNMESLFYSFQHSFNDDRKDKNYFLDMLKTVNEDEWEYEINTERYGCLYYSIYKTEILKYNNIKIVCKNNHYDNLEDADTDFIIIVFVSNRKIFETDDETSELAIEIIDFIERVEKRVNGKNNR